MKHGTNVTQVVSSAPSMAATHGSSAAGVAVGAEERDEVHDHDQRAGRRLGQRESADHLARRQPAVGLDGALGDEGEHGVGAAERHQRGAGEEQALLGEHAVAAGPARATASSGAAHSARPTPRTLTARAARRRLGVQGVVGDHRCRTVRRRRRARRPRDDVRARSGPAPSRPRPRRQDDDRERDAEDGQRHERGDRDRDQRSVRQRAPADPDDGLHHDREHRRARARRTARRPPSVSPNADVDAGQREQGETARAARTGCRRPARRAVR